MINCNPETVSTDYDTSDRLYFEPLTLEDVLGVCELEQPEGVVVQFGGQTPLKLAAGLDAAGVPILGTSIDAIDLAEDRSRFGALLDRLGYQAPPVRHRALSAEEALERAAGGRLPAARAPELRARRPGDGDRLQRRRASRDYLRRASARQTGQRRSTSTASSRTRSRSTSTRSATARRSGSPGSCSTSRRPGSTPATRPACCRRTRSASEMLAQIREQTAGIARALGVVGLLNVQFAIHGDDGLHVIEANPRASRTVPFVSKAIGLPLAKLACRLMLGERLADLDLPADDRASEPRVRQGGGAAVRPLRRRRLAARPGDALDRRGDGHRPRLPDRVRQGPGRGRRARCPPAAPCSSRSPTATRRRPPGSPRCCTTSASRSSPPAARRRRSRGWASPRAAINKIGEGSPHVVDWIERGEVDLVINTPVGTGARTDGYEIRSRRGRPRDPLHHDDGRRHGGGPGDRRGPARRARGALAPGDPRAAPVARLRRERGRRRRGSRRRSAARAAAVTGRERSAPTSSCAAVDPRRARAPGRAVLHAQRRASAGAEETASGRSCRARSASCARRRRRPPSCSSCSRTSGPGTDRLCELDGRRRAAAPRTARAAASRRRATGAGRCSSAAGWASRRWRSCRTSSAAATAPAPARLPRRARTPPGAAPAAEAPRVATDDGSVGHHGLVTELLERRARRRHADARSTPAGRRRCSRRCARCAPSARSPAQLALESGMACGFGACFGCVVPTRERLRAALRRRARCSTPSSSRRARAGSGPLSVDASAGIELAHPVINASGTFDAIAARRAFGDALLRALPVRGLRVQDGHARAARRATRRRGCGSCRPG